jgi:hypothetical protein
MAMEQPVQRAAEGAMPTLRRRQAIALVGGGVAAVSLANRAAATDVRFDVYRKGSNIGTHVIQFDRTGGTLKVASRVDLQVKVAFITAYRYEQTGQDEWQDDVLVRTGSGPTTTARTRWWWPRRVAASWPSMAPPAATPPGSGR